MRSDSVVLEILKILNWDGISAIFIQQVNIYKKHSLSV